jgi:hypothetical protein
MTTIREAVHTASPRLMLAPTAPPHGRKQLVAVPHAEVFDSRSVNVLLAKPTQEEYKKPKTCCLDANLVVIDCHMKKLVYRRRKHFLHSEMSFPHVRNISIGFLPMLISLWRHRGTEHAMLPTESVRVLVTVVKRGEGCNVVIR